MFNIFQRWRDKQERREKENATLKVETAKEIVQIVPESKDRKAGRYARQAFSGVAVPRHGVIWE
jgi:hypothetical protein